MLTELPYTWLPLSDSTLNNIKTANKTIINLNKKILYPYFITGLTDAEGSFIVQIIKSSSYRLG